MEHPDYSMPVKSRRSHSLRWAIVLVVVLIAAVGTAKVVRKVMGYRPLPPTRIALRQPAAPTTDVIFTGAVEDWPKWRGPRADGISRETGIVSQFPLGGPAQLWSADVGIGYSSPVAVAGKVYLFTLNQGKETLTAFDAATGQILWSDESAGPAWTSRYPGTRATPLVEGDAVYIYGGGGELTCRDLATGKPRWQVNILTITGSTPLSWGQGSSPLIAGDLVYVQGGQGGSIAVALKKADGTVAWQSEARGVGGYAHPIVADVSGQQQLIVFGGKAVYGMDPATGKTIWQQPWETNYDVNAATPVYRDGHLFVSSEYNRGCMMLRVTPGGAEKLWENKEVQSKINGMVLDRDHLYANSSGTIKCMSWPDGKIAWSASDAALRLGAGGSIVRVGDDRLLCMSERGKLTIARATPEKIEVLAQAQLLDGREIWSTPLLYAGRLYAKGDTEFVCFDLTGKAAPQTQAAEAAGN
jgi:outer membrane protein assembly factor BamB